MLWEAADPRIPKQSTLLAQVSSALDQYLQQAGDEFLQLFKNISSGRTPEGSRPCDKWEYGRGGLIAKRGDEAPEFPGNVVSVRVQDRYLSVEVPQADLEQEIADMPAHQRPKTAEERRQLQEQMDIDCTNFGRRRHWRRCASAIMSFDSITACTRSSRSRGLITRRWSGR